MRDLALGEQWVFILVVFIGNIWNYMLFDLLLLDFNLLFLAHDHRFWVKVLKRAKYQLTVFLCFRKTVHWIVDGNLSFVGFQSISYSLFWSLSSTLKFYFQFRSKHAVFWFGRLLLSTSLTSFEKIIYEVRKSLCTFYWVSCIIWSSWFWSAVRPWIWLYWLIKLFWRFKVILNCS